MNGGPIKLFALRERLRQSMWLLPGLLIVVAATAAIGLVVLDHYVTTTNSRFAFGGRADGAREVISTIAGSMVAFIGTVFSITVIVLQLSSSQFSPRALRSFLRDRRSQLPLGVFLATLVYALVVLWTIRTGTESQDEFVPNITISGAYFMLLVSLGTFVFYIHHVAQSIRVANVVHRIGAEALDVLEARYPDVFDSSVVTTAPDDLRGIGIPMASVTYGTVMAYDKGDLASEAERLGGTVELLRYVGDFVPLDSPIARWSGPTEAAEELAVEGFVSFGRERTMKQDLAFGIRQLVDIAEKALSPSLNDPTTASQALDQIHNLMRRLAQRNFPHEVMVDGDGTPRLITHERDWGDFVHLAFDEIRDYSTGSRQVRTRLRAVLEDLAAAVPDARREPIDAQLAQLPDDAVRPR